MDYFFGRQNFLPNALDTAHHINRETAGGRGGLCELAIGSDATPNEYSAEYQVVRTTTMGTSPVGSGAISKQNPFSPNALCTYNGGGYSGAEPTIGEVLMDISVHQKALFRWAAYPGREIWTANASNAGIGVVVVGQSTGFFISTSCQWVE